MKQIFGISFAAVLATTMLSGAPAAAAGAFGHGVELRDAGRAPIVEVQARRRPVRTSSRHRRNALTAGALVGAAIVGGAIIANSQPRRRYYDDGYYYGEPVYGDDYYHAPTPYYRPYPRSRVYRHPGYQPNDNRDGQYVSPPPTVYYNHPTRHRYDQQQYRGPNPGPSFER